MLNRGGSRGDSPNRPSARARACATTSTSSSSVSTWASACTRLTTQAAAAGTTFPASRTAWACTSPSATRSKDNMLMKSGRCTFRTVRFFVSCHKNKKESVRIALFLSGATRNRDKFTSSCISSLFRNSVRVISSYCSTVGLLRFAYRCSG